ncbi:MAG: ADP-ribosylglycohydrolase family protein [Candidatus Helarchaeota archaeon]|nr:ADP-ribosylglycohydrolase family protein [Candidatus Helarchaeota archaeon]
MLKKKKKFIGCIVGTGVGDALGEPVEGCTRIYIENYNVDIPKLYLGRYTDDTQLTIAIAESLIRAKGYDPNVLSKRFIEWLDEPPIGPGRGCLTSIHRLRNGVHWSESGSDSGANGCAMRISPIGLFFHNDIEMLIKAAKESSLITHRHWAAICSGIVVARAVAYLVNHEVLDIDDMLNTVADLINQKEYKEFHDNLLKLKKYLELPYKEALMELGLIGVQPPFFDQRMVGIGIIHPYAMSTVLSALYCFLKTPKDFKKSVIEAITGGGDTDTVGAICGTFSGTWNGIDNIPQIWVEGLIDSEKIISIGDKLWETYLDYKK